MGISFGTSRYKLKMSYTIFFNIKQEVANIISPALKEKLVSFYVYNNFNDVVEMQNILDNYYTLVDANTIMQFLVLEENQQGFSPQEQQVIFDLLNKCVHDTECYNEKVVTIKDIRDLLYHTIQTNKTIFWY